MCIRYSCIPCIPCDPVVPCEPVVPCLSLIHIKSSKRSNPIAYADLFVKKKRGPGAGADGEYTLTVCHARDTADIPGGDVLVEGIGMGENCENIQYNAGYRVEGVVRRAKE